MTENNQIVVVLVRIPEHYDKNGENLVGQQVLRNRLIKSMGFRIMEIHCNDISRAK